MNKLKILVASALCSLFVIGLAGCGDENPEGSACTQATAENDCASSTATKYVCHKQGTAETCLRDCTDSGKKACTAQEKCVDSSNGRKACVPTTPAGGDDKCGDKTCKADEVCNKTDAANPKCEKKVEKKTYAAILIVDTSSGEACNQDDAGSDIAGVVIKSAKGDTLGYYGTSSRETGSGVKGDYITSDTLPEDPVAPDADNCPFKKLSKKEHREKTHVLGCGGKGVYQNQTNPVVFQTGDKVQIYEYNGKVCSSLPDSPDDTYKVYACVSKDANVEANTRIEIDKDCFLQAENLSGYQEITIK